MAEKDELARNKYTFSIVESIVNYLFRIMGVSNFTKMLARIK